MKVWVVSIDDYDERDILGIYDQEAKAHLKRYIEIERRFRIYHSKYQRQELERSIVVQDYEVQ